MSDENQQALPGSDAADFQRVFDATPCPCLVVAADAPVFTIIDANAAYCRATSTRRSDIVGSGLFVAFPDNPDDPGADGVENLRMSLERVIDTRAADRMPIQKYDIRVPGRPEWVFEARWWRPLNIPVLDVRGEVRWIIHHVDDVTSDQVASDALRSTEERLRQIVEAAHDHAIISLDGEGCITSWSRGAELVFGWTAEEALGQHGRLIFVPEDVAEGRPESEMRIAREHGRAQDERWHIREDGSRFWASGSLAPLWGAAGEVEGYLKIARDETKRRQAEEALARAKDDLERLVEERTATLLREMEERRRAEEALRQGEKLQAIGQLTGGIAHDFNNILQVVAAAATLLDRPGLTEERRRQILDGLLQATKNAKALTGRLLAFARRQALQPRAFDVNGSLNGLADLLGRTVEPKMEIATDLDPDAWPVLADPGQLEVAVLNLVMNARDAMPEGGTLTLQTRNATLEGNPERPGGDYVCLAVADKGHGMSPSVLSRAFDPFFTTKDPERGTGLGLSQVHGFIKQTGGDVAIESTPGEGTVVRLYLPRAASLPEAGAEPADRRVPRDQIQHRAGLTVLVVEDNEDVAAFAAGMLATLGYATLRAGSADEALRLLEGSARVDAVFSDIVMPGTMNGLQLARHLRRHRPAVAILLATGYSEAHAHGTEEAVAEVIGKPYGLQELVPALDRALAAVEGEGSRES